MLNLKELTDRRREVTALIKWWCSKSSMRYHLLMLRFGSYHDFINEIWSKMLQSVRDGRELDVNFTTFVVNHAGWTLFSHLGAPSVTKRIRFQRKISLGRPVQPDDATYRESSPEFMLRDVLMDVLRTLTQREREIVELRFGLRDEPEKTLEEVAKVFGLTRERIRQIEAKAIKKLQHFKNSSLLFPFVSHLFGEKEEQRESEQQEEEQEEQEEPEIRIDESKLAQIRKSEAGRVLIDHLFGPIP